MKLEFDNIEELVDFIEKMKLNKGKSNETNVKICPYGFINCPYNQPVTPYIPISPITVNSSSSTDRTTEIGLKNITSKDFEKD